MNERTKEESFSEGPREKLERTGASSLSDLELIMILVGQGTSGHPVQEVSKDIQKLLDRGEDLSPAELKCIPGMGSAKAATILAAMELGRRKTNRKLRSISTPQDIYREIRHFASREQENLIVVSLNGAHEVIGVHIATIGLLNKTIVHPREVFAPAIRDRAAAVAIAHNHPSGNLEPSQDDKAVTARILHSGETLGIKVIDHLIISDSNFFSFLEHGMLQG